MDDNVFIVSSGPTFQTRCTLMPFENHLILRRYFLTVNLFCTIKDFKNLTLNQHCRKKKYSVYENIIVILYGF